MTSQFEEHMVFNKNKEKETIDLKDKIRTLETDFEDNFKELERLKDIEALSKEKEEEMEDMQDVVEKFKMENSTIKN